MTFHSNGPSAGPRVLLLGGTSEIGLAILAALRAPAGTEVILAGRDPQRLEAAGKALGPGARVSVARYDGTDVASHQAFADEVCAAGVPDLVIAAAGVLIPQPQVARDVPLAARMIGTNFTGHVTTLLAFAGPMRSRGTGTMVVLS
ncbi:MAG TPA: SDR family NAD(P)-dependent oxidoreductase, partial [Trebonia sp.]|nr:SDR family NAD(P)-dependent oxidoreductase [Trebonia sp.]